MANLTWQKECPRKSGWYWVRETAETGEPPATFEVVSIMEVEGRDETEDGCVWVNEANRIYLTPGARGEDGETQDDWWLKWEWAGPIPDPKPGAPNDGERRP